MNVALAGLTAREETALVMLIGSTLPDFQCDTVPPGRQVPLPLADLYVLDLAGRGWARWTQEVQESLLTSLNGAPAVLVAPAFDETWAALEASRIPSQSLVLLHKPYGIGDMRSALLKAAPKKTLRPAPVPRPLPVTLRAPAAPAAVPVRPFAAPVTAPPVVIAPAPPADAPLPAPVAIAPLSMADFQARVAALPDSEPKQFLSQLAEALLRGQPFEVRVTLLNRLIFSPDVQWAASNMALPMLEAMCQSDTLAQDLSIDTIEDRDALSRAERLGMRIQPLANLLGMLMHYRLNRPL